MITYVLLGTATLVGVALFLRPSRLSAKSYSDVTVSDLELFMKNKNAVLIDVRTTREINQGVIGNPLKIELGPNMQQKMKTLDKNKKYILYCRSGRRSVLASKIMTRMGFKDVNNLLGGYLEWNASK